MNTNLAEQYNVNEVNQMNVVELFLDQYDSVATKKNYESTLRNFFNVSNVKEITDWQIKKVKYEEIQSWVKDMFNAGKSDNTVKRNLATIKSFYDYCDDICKNPINKEKIEKLMKVNLRKDNITKGVALTKLEIAKLIEVIDNKKHKIIVRLMFNTGGRISEILGICKEDFIYKEDEDSPEKTGWYVKLNGKGRKYRFVPLTLNMFEEVVDYMDTFNISEGQIFKMTSFGVNKMLKRYCKLAGIREISPHDTRRTNAVRVSRNGVELDEIRRNFGHTTIRMTLKYLKDEDMFNRTVANAIDFA